ncbi:MAG TPA: porin [Nevskiaceae bacterium]|nr:porin [Nevskiaceae bacterium]
MNKLLKIGAIASAIAAMYSTNALADSASTKGGLTIKSDDGRFEGTLGGRLQYDYTAFQADNEAVGGHTTTADGPYMRRAYITLSGKIYDFKYKLENDFAGGSTGYASKELWIGHDLFGGFIKAGHMQPAYGMEELTSSNELLFTERPFISNNTVFSGREFQNGVSYNADGHGMTGMVTIYNANTADDKATGANPVNGSGYSGRGTWAPINDNGSVLHLGLAIDEAKFSDGTLPAAVSALYAEKNGSKITVASAGYKSQTTFVGELAGAVGPFTAQAEYANAKYKYPAAADQTLDSFYVQASWMITGESKPYKAAAGVFGNPKPNSVDGAWEAKVRYDYVKNKDLATAPKASEISLGVNYYFNDKVRMMLDYNIGNGETTAGKDKPKALVARAQLAF